MADLAKLVVKLEAESSKLRAELERTNSKLNHWGKNVDRVARRAKAAFASIAGAYVGFAGIKAATGELASFEKTLSGVRAVTRATDEQMVALKATARELGAVTQFSATQAALTLIAANLAMKLGTSMLRGTVERAILRGRFGESAAERILKEKRVKGSGLASTAAKYATRSRPGALVVGAGLLAKTLFDKGGERRARLSGKKKR